MHKKAPDNLSGAGYPDPSDSDAIPHNTAPGELSPRSTFRILNVERGGHYPDPEEVIVRILWGGGGCALEQAHTKRSKL